MTEEFERGEYAVQPPVVKKINKHFIAIHDDNGVRLIKGDGTYTDNYIDAKAFPSREMIRGYLKAAKWKDMKKTFIHSCEEQRIVLMFPAIPNFADEPADKKPTKGKKGIITDIEVLRGGRSKPEQSS